MAGGLCTILRPPAENPMSEPVLGTCSGRLLGLVDWWSARQLGPWSLVAVPRLARAPPLSPRFESPQEAGDESCLG